MEKSQNIDLYNSGISEADRLPVPQFLLLEIFPNKLLSNSKI